MSVFNSKDNVGKHHRKIHVDSCRFMPHVAENKRVRVIRRVKREDRRKMGQIRENIGMKKYPTMKATGRTRTENECGHFAERVYKTKDCDRTRRRIPKLKCLPCAILIRASYFLFRPRLHADCPCDMVISCCIPFCLIMCRTILVCASIFC